MNVGQRTYFYKDFTWFQILLLRYWALLDGDWAACSARI